MKRIDAQRPVSWTNVICHENQCRYRKMCANHQSANSYRTISGFKPVFQMICGLIYCETCDSQPAEQTMGGEVGKPLLTGGQGGVRISELKERTAY